MTMELHASPEEVMRAVEELQDFGQQHGIAEAELFGPLLALEECGANIVAYSLGRESGLTFRVTIEYEEPVLTIQLRDRGPEFDPTTYRKPHSARSDPEGGWGIELVRRSMDEIRYKREGMENILDLKKLIRATDKQ